jgi:hypothetical protein
MAPFSDGGEQSRAATGALRGVPIKNNANLVNDIGHL